MTYDSKKDWWATAWCGTFNGAALVKPAGPTFFAHIF